MSNRITTTQRLMAWLAIAALVAAACGGTATETTTTAAEAAPATTTTAPPTTTTTAARPTTTTPSTTVAPTTTTTLAPLVDVDSLIGGNMVTPIGAVPEGWRMPAGRYIGSRFVSQPVFSVDETMVYLDIAGLHGFANPGVVPEELDAVVFFEPAGLLPTEAIGEHPDHHPVVPVNTIPVPDDFDAWLDAASQIVVTASGETDIAGAPATWWELIVDPDATATYGCGRPGCVAFFVMEEVGPFAIWQNANFKVWRLGGEGEGMWVFMQSRPARLEATTALAEGLLDDMTYGG